MKHLMIISILVFTCAALYADDIASRQEHALLYYYNHDKYEVGTIRGDVTKAYSILALAVKGNASVTDANIAYANHLLESLVWPEIALADDMYWMLPHLSRILADASMNAFLTHNAKESIKSFLLSFVLDNDNLTYAASDINNLHHVVDSENHDILQKQVCFTTAQIFKNNPEWANIAYPDGISATDRYVIWRNYFENWLREKAIKGVNVEAGTPSYAGVFLESIYIIRDLAEDVNLKKRAGQYLNLYFADQALCSLNGVRGGAKSRCYKDASSYSYDNDHGAYYAWILTGTPAAFGSGNVPYCTLPSLTSNFRVDDVVLNLYNQNGRGNYEYTVSRPGSGANSSIGVHPHYDLFFPSKIRWYNWCTPKYILGGVTLDENDVYTAISEQNRWNGLIAVENVSSRIYFTPDTTVNTYYDYIAVQHKGTMLIRKSSKATAGIGFKMFVSSTFTRISDSQWIFGANTDNSVYYGVYATKGDLWGMKYTQVAGPLSGTYITFNNPDTIVIFESALAGDYASFDAFKTLVKSRTKGLSGTRYNYTSIYDSAVLSMFSDKSLPKINDVNIALVADKVFTSPFINADYGSTTVTITDQYANEMVLDFTAPVGYLAGDLNKDGYVNFQDLVIMASQWGMRTFD